MKDLLALLHGGVITTEKAEKIVDDLMEAIHAGESPPEWASELGLTKHEATAYPQGASLSDLASLRYDGWPTECSVCGRPLDYKTYGWWFFRNDDGTPCLKHIVCPPN